VSDWPRVITDVLDDEMHVSHCDEFVVIDVISEDGGVSMMLEVDQCAALIAALTDAAKVVMEENA
jgi:hypothetical protein